MNSTLAARLGRPDLIGVPLDPFGGTSSNPQPGATFSGNVSAALDGRVTAGVMILMLLGVMAFYVWTREHQA